ncbi:MAG: hypothetical protein IKP51_04395 [Treponema sp.]|nr:hypothetical protein [Treponema sp.]
MENAKHLPLLLRFSLTKKANSSLKEEFALEITFSGNLVYSFREAKTAQKRQSPFREIVLPPLTALFRLRAIV